MRLSSIIVFNTLALLAVRCSKSTVGYCLTKQAHQISVEHYFEDIFTVNLITCF